MSPRHLTLIVTLSAIVAAVFAAWLLLGSPSENPFRLSDRIISLPLEEADGEVVAVFPPNSERPEVTLDGDAFFREVIDLQSGAGRPPTKVRRALNITSYTGLFWVSIGIIGQVLFTGRMLVQWLASEREKRSVVPVAFWWLSLVGATMLIIYFAWRADLVGVLGQSTGWLIYFRNLWLIHDTPKQVASR